MNRGGNGSSPDYESIKSQRTGTSRPRPAFWGAMRETFRGVLSPRFAAVKSRTSAFGIAAFGFPI